MEWGDKTQAEVEAILRKALIVAFVRGAQWWEWHKEKATIMWQSDRDLAEIQATQKYSRRDSKADEEAQS